MTYLQSHGPRGLGALVCALLFTLVACGGGNTSTTETHVVSGMVQGIPEGTTLTLEITGGERVVVSTDGTFSFATPREVSSTYEIRVVGAPAGRAVEITNGSGTVTNSMQMIEVQVVPGYVVGGTVSGLSGALTIRLQDGQTLMLSQDGTFTFPLLVADGSAYRVTLDNAPATQRCSVTNGTGTVSMSNVDDVVITCLDTFTVGGTVSGLTAPIALQLNSEPSIPIVADGSFEFPTRLVAGETYTVTVPQQTQGQLATVTNGSGSIAATSVTDVTVECSARFMVSGTARGIVGEGQLELNGGYPLQIDTNGTFTFPDGLEDGATYDVQLLGWTNADANTAQELLGGSGTIASANVSDLELVHFGLWQHPADGSANLGGDEVINASAAVDSDGTAIYAYSDGGEVRISTYDGTSWADPTTDYSNGAADDYQLKADLANGTGLVAWIESDGSVQRVYATVRLAGTWSTPTALSDATVGAYELAASVGPNGTAVVAFTQLDATSNGNRMMYVAEYAEGSWTLPSDLDDYLSPDVNDCWTPVLEVADNRDALLAWTQSGTTNDHLMTAQKVNGAWYGTSSIESAKSFTTTSVGRYALAMNATGEGLLTWSQSDGSDDRVYLAAFDGGVWTHPTQITNHALPAEFTNASQPDVALRDDGTAMLTWITTHGSPSETSVFARVFENGTWGAVTLADALDADTTVSLPQVALRADGDALVIWRGPDIADLYARPYRAGRFVAPAPTTAFTPGGSGQMSVQAFEFGPTGLGVMAMVMYGSGCASNDRAYRSFVHR